MNDQELLRGARECTTISGDCANCPFDKTIGADGTYCSDLLVRALAERMEKLSERCARYAEEIAVQQERERWISVEERLPEAMEWVLCRCRDGNARVLRYDHIMDDWDFAVTERHGHCFSRDTVTHWKPLPEGPEEGER